MLFKGSVFSIKTIGFLVLVFFTAALLIYFPSFSFDLTYLDDQIWALEYQGFLQKGSNVGYFFSHSDFLSGIFYRPILNCSFLADAMIGGGALWSYRLTNFLLHVFNAFLLCGIFVAALGRNRRVSFWMSLVFLCHPALAQSVVWIPGRTDSLMAFFCLAGFLSFVHYLKTRKVYYAVLFFALWILSLLTKETAVVLPFLCAGYAIARGFVKQQGWRKCVGFCVVSIVVGAGWWFVRSKILSGTSSLSGQEAAVSFLKNIPAIIFYLGKAWFPFNLSVLPILWDANWIWGWSAVFVMICIGIMRRMYFKEYIFGLFWFTACLLPSFVLSQVMYEYRLYMPIIGILFVVSMTVGSLNSRRATFILGALVLVLGFNAHVYGHQFKDRMTFWENAARNSPHSPLAQRNLGAMYFLDGKLDEAEQYMLKAAALNEREHMVHNNLGLIYMQRGDLNAAEKEFLLEIAFHPDYGNAYFNYALVKYQQKDAARAEEFLLKTLQYEPLHKKACLALIEYYRRIGQTERQKYFIDYYEKRIGENIPEKLGIFDERK